MVKTTYLLFVCLILASCCDRLVTLHYYTGLNISQNYTWGSSLQMFFMKEYDMTAIPIKSKELKNDISIIKNEIILKNQVIVPDDGNYSFGFIIEKDTLFADNSLEFWRYKNKGMAYKIPDTSKRIILNQYKLPPNQQ